MRKDFSFAFIPHPLTGDITTITGSNAIKQSVKNIVMTNFYERGFNIDVAGNVPIHLFELAGETEASTIADSIKTSLKNFEPNIEVIDVQVYQDSENSLVVNVIYNEYNNPEDKSIIVSLRNIHNR